MLSFVSSKLANTIVVEITGTPKKEDAVMLDEAVEEKFGSEKDFNLFIIAKDLDLPTVQGVTERLKFLAKHSGRVNKAVISSDESIAKAVKNLANVIPGIEAKHFSLDEQEEAWDWLRH